LRYREVLIEYVVKDTQGNDLSMESIIWHRTVQSNTSWNLSSFKMTAFGLDNNVLSLMLSFGILLLAHVVFCRKWTKCCWQSKVNLPSHSVAVTGSECKKCLISMLRGF
jgi:hypothetical protein